MEKKILILIGVIFIAGLVFAQSAPRIFSTPIWVQPNDTEAFKVGVPGSASFVVDSTIGKVHTNTLYPIKPADKIGDKNHDFSEIWAKQFYGQYITLVTDTPYTCDHMCKALETMDPKAGKVTCQGAIRFDRTIVTCQDQVWQRNCICRNG